MQNFRTIFDKFKANSQGGEEAKCNLCDTQMFPIGSCGSAGGISRYLKREWNYN